MSEICFFSVVDNGIGMDKMYSEIYLNPLDNCILHEYKETGIGLAVFMRIIDRHGGRIWVESEFDKGSIFLFHYSY